MARWYMDPGIAKRGLDTRCFERRATFWHAVHVLATILVSSLSFEVTEKPLFPKPGFPKPGYTSHQYWRFGVRPILADAPC